jgi:zinc finger SWIM domain-containing protein 3
LSKNKYVFAATQQHDHLAKEKARGIKVKEKAIRGSERPISDFEKATQKKKKV